MKLKQLEGLLGGLTQFPAPKVGTPPPPPRLARLPFPSPARFWEVGKSGGSILLLPLGGVVGAGGAGAVPDGPSHRVADALHGQCCACILLRFRCFARLCFGREGCHISLLGMVLGMRCGSLFVVRLASGIMELGAGATKCNSVGSASTELLH